MKKNLLFLIIATIILLTGCGHTHNWLEATCITPKTCSICGQTEGLPLEHNVINWTIDTEPTCTQIGIRTGTCTKCNNIIQQEIPQTEHTAGEWVIAQNATINNPGIKTVSCTKCGEVLETQSFILTEEEFKEIFKSSCIEYDYETIARNPEKYKSTYGKYTGEIIQVLEDGNDIQMRVNITKERYGYSDTIFVLYTKQEDESRLLEDDIITIYGINAGTVSYESVLGATITLPCVYAQYIDLN